MLIRFVASNGLFAAGGTMTAALAVAILCNSLMSGRVASPPILRARTARPSRFSGESAGNGGTFSPDMKRINASTTLLNCASVTPVAAFSSATVVGVDASPVKYSRRTLKNTATRSRKSIPNNTVLIRILVSDRYFGPARRNLFAVPFDSRAAACIGAIRGCCRGRSIECQDLL